MQAAGAAPLVIVECGCWHENQTSLLAEAMAWLGHDMTQLVILVNMIYSTRHGMPKIYVTVC